MLETSRRRLRIAMGPAGHNVPVTKQYTQRFVDAIETLSNVLYLLETKIDDPAVARELLQLAKPAWARIIAEVREQKR